MGSLTATAESDGPSRCRGNPSSANRGYGPEQARGRRPATRLPRGAGAEKKGAADADGAGAMISDGNRRSVRPDPARNGLRRPAAHAAPSRKANRSAPPCAADGEGRGTARGCAGAGKPCCGDGTASPQR